MSGCILTAVGMILAPQILVLMGTPESVLPNSIVYFRVYFAGSVAFVMYNIVMGILQAVGDSRHPLYYLIFSSIVNIVLDLLFVGLLGFGVGAAALATIISQFSSAFLCMLRLMRTKDVYQVQISQIRFHKGMLGQIIGIGLPSGMQNSIISFANIIVQTNINKFGVMAVAGCGVYSKIEGFAFCRSPVLQCRSQRSSGRISAQNSMTGQKRCVFWHYLFDTACRSCRCDRIFAIPQLAAAFNNEAQVVEFATRQAHIEAFFIAFWHFRTVSPVSCAVREIYRANVCHACILVHHKNYIHHGYRAFYPENPGHLLGVPADLVNQFGDLLIYFLKANWLYSFEKK